MNIENKSKNSTKEIPQIPQIKTEKSPFKDLTVTTPNLYDTEALAKESISNQEGKSLCERKFVKETISNDESSENTNDELPLIIPAVAKSNEFVIPAKSSYHIVEFSKSFTPEAIEALSLQERAIYEYGSSFGKVVIIQRDAAEHLLKGYLECYLNSQFMANIKQIPFAVTLGLTHDDGRMSGLFPEVKERLSKLSMLFPVKCNEGTKFCLPFLREGDFRLWDNFGWFKYDETLKMKLQNITEICNIIASYLELSCIKIEKFVDSTNTSIVNTRNLSSGKMTSISNKKHSQSPINLTIVNGGNAFDSHNTKNRLQMKHQGLTYLGDMKKEILKSLKLNEQFFKQLASYLNTLYPCKHQMVMIFEMIVNEALRLYAFFDKFKDKNPLFNRVFKEQLQATQVLVQFIELLLPYAIEINEHFDIKILLNNSIKTLREIGKIMHDRLNKDFDKYKQFELESKLKLKKRTNESLKPQQPKAPTLQPIKKGSTTSNPSAQKAVKTISLEERQAIELTKEENKKLLEAKQTALKKKQDELKQVRGEQKEIKGQAIQERKKVQAQKIVDTHLKLEEEKEQQAQKARLQSNCKIHDLPTPEFVEKNIIAKLKGPKLEYFQRVFGYLNNDNTMDHNNVIDLAKQIRDILAQNKIGCADDLLNEIKARIHRRHSKDKGALMPRHYIKILRTCFILFRISPGKNSILGPWKPQTEKDFKAITKCLQRVMDKLAFDQANSK